MDQGFYEDQCLDVEILEGGVDIVPQQVLADGDADFAIAWVPKALPDARGGRRHRRHRPDLPALGHAAGVVQGRRHHHRRPTSPARTIGNWGFGNEYEIFAALAKDGLDPATDVDARRSSSSTWSACSRATSTPPRR